MPTSVAGQLPYLYQPRQCGFGRLATKLDWLTSGRLSPEDASRLSALLDQLAKLCRNHIAIEDTEVFPFAASILAASDRESVGIEMAARRGAGAANPTIKSR